MPQRLVRHCFADIGQNAGRGGGGGRGPVSPEVQAQRLATQREDLDVSIKYTKELLARL